MNNHLDTQLIIRLLTKELTDELNESEEKQLNQWLNESPLNKELYERLHSKKYKEERQKIIDQFDEQSAWKSIQKKIEPPKARYIQKTFWKISAAASILIIVGSLFFYSQFSNTTDQKVAFENISPGSNQAILTISGDRQIQLNNLDTIIEGQSSGININPQVIRYSSTPKKITKNTEYHTLETPFGGEYTLLLADGTKVWLNAGSKITYPEFFITDKRKVYAEGEVYFEVAQDPNKPFLVQTGPNTIRVLGTHFNIRDYATENSTSITLCEGSIELTTKKSVHVLTPNQQAQIFKNTSETHIKEVDADLYTAWKDGFFMFKKVPLKTILDDLSRWYNTTIFFADEEIKHTEFSLYVNRQDKIINVLEMLQATEEINFSMDGEAIVVEKSN